MKFFPEVSLDTYQAEAIARGLFAIAQVDGVHEREAALVGAFWSEAGGSVQSLSELERRTQITSTELATALPTAQLRHLFLKSALLLTIADGQVSDMERALLRDFAKHLEAEAEMPHLEAQVKDFLLSQLAHVQNTDALTEVAKKLSL